MLLKKIPALLVIGSLLSLPGRSQTDSATRTYRQVITEKAVTHHGLLTVHKVGKRYFFELSDKVFDRNFLAVTRIAKATEVHTYLTPVGYPGDMMSQHIVQFSKGENNRVFLRSIRFGERATDSTEDGLSRALNRSSLQPISAVFPVVTSNPAADGVVIDITDYVQGDKGIFTINDENRKIMSLPAFQPDRSYVETIRAFPANVEIRAVKTFSDGKQNTPTFELYSTLLLLPEQVMTPRFADKRVGFRANFFTDFDRNSQAVDSNNTAFINRWRLEPSAVDQEKYLRKEPIEPRKPIVFYIDPATPRKWVPYLKQGVQDWQKAFEKAGFKNAIYATDAPVNDPDWNLEDARYNTIVYKPSFFRNAASSNIVDPRSGEILQSQIDWHHSILRLLNTQYFIQASTIDMAARQLNFDDALMGKLIRNACSREIGYTLGLTDNLAASSTVPVDSLRNGQWLEKNSLTPSIMDDAVYNYIAQPADRVPVSGLIQRIGIYDEWAIEWGYTWYRQFKTPAAEATYLTKQVTGKLGADPRLLFIPATTTDDPRCQKGDLGDNSVKAGLYGIKNLQFIVPRLVAAVKEADQDHARVRELEQAVADQYYNYLDIVAKNIGGVYFTPKISDQPGNVFEPVPRKKQQEALQFLQDQLFTTPHWTLNYDLFMLAGGMHRLQRITVLQQKILDQLLSIEKYGAFIRFDEQPALYSFSDMLRDLKKGIWRELAANRPIDEYRRNLQKIYAERLYELIKQPADKPGPLPGQRKVMEDWYAATDVLSILKGHARELISEINRALPGYQDELTRLHFSDVRDRLRQSIETGNK